MEIQVLSPGSSRDELKAAIGLLSAEAGRELRTDQVGRPNPRWADLHTFINELLDWLEE